VNITRKEKEVIALKNLKPIGRSWKKTLSQKVNRKKNEIFASKRKNKESPAL